MLDYLSEVATTDMDLETCGMVMAFGVRPSGNAYCAVKTINLLQVAHGEILFWRHDGFVIFDRWQEGFSFGINGNIYSVTHEREYWILSWTRSLLSCEYVGEVLIFNEKLSESDRSMVTSYLMSKWGISSSGNTTCTESSIGEPVSVFSQLQSLKPPKCMPPGGDKLQFDGMNWICVCNGAWTGPTCEQPPSPPPPAPPPQPTVPPPDQSKLSFGVSANFQGSSKDPPCPDEFPFWVSCRQPTWRLDERMVWYSQ